VFISQIYFKSVKPKNCRQNPRRTFHTDFQESATLDEWMKFIILGQISSSRVDVQPLYSSAVDEIICFRLMMIVAENQSKQSMFIQEGRNSSKVSSCGEFFYCTSLSCTP
jgi:hypothetical protein